MLLLKTFRGLIGLFLLVFSVTNVQSTTQNPQDFRDSPVSIPTYSFVLFYSSQCPHCQRFAPVLRSVANEIGLPIIAYSADGGALPGLPYPRVADNATKASYFHGRQHPVPALFLLNNRSLHAFPVSVGYFPKKALEDRLATLAPRVLKFERGGA